MLLALPAAVVPAAAVLLLGGGAGLILLAARGEHFAFDTGSANLRVRWRAGWRRHGLVEAWTKAAARAGERCVAACVAAPLLAGCGGRPGRPGEAEASRGRDSRIAARGTADGGCWRALPPAGDRAHPRRLPAGVWARDRRHVELFAANHVVLIAGGIGTAAPRTVVDARVTHAGCFGSVVTLDPTGIVYARAGSTLTLADLFRSWGQPLSAADGRLQRAGRDARDRLHRRAAATGAAGASR